MLPSMYHIWDEGEQRYVLNTALKEQLVEDIRNIINIQRDNECFNSPIEYKGYMFTINSNSIWDLFFVANKAALCKLANVEFPAIMWYADKAEPTGDINIDKMVSMSADDFLLLQKLVEERRMLRVAESNEKKKTLMTKSMAQLIEIKESL